MLPTFCIKRCYREAGVQGVQGVHVCPAQDTEVRSLSAFRFTYLTEKKQLVVVFATRRNVPRGVGEQA